MGRGASRKRRERPHRPNELGPRLIKRGRWYAADLRPWAGGRTTLRDPNAQGWPEKGERTESLQVAEKWRWAYVSHLSGIRERRQLGIPDTSKKLRKALDEWLRYRETQVADATWRGNRTAAARLVEEFGPDRPVSHITTAELQAMFDRLLRDGYKRTTLHTERTQMGTFFGWCGGPNPVSGVTLPKPVHRDIFTWTDAELERIRAAADAVDRNRRNPVPPARLAVELALGTAARQRELFALRWDDFDPEARTVRIRRQLPRYGLADPTVLKGKRSRTTLVLPSWWELHRQASGYVLADADGKPMRYRAQCTLIQRVLDTANLNGIGRGWHDFRRTYGRLFLEMGGWMDELQRSLGHKSIRTTEDSYGEFQTDRATQFARSRIYGEGRALRVVDGGRNM